MVNGEAGKGDTPRRQTKKQADKYRENYEAIYDKSRNRRNRRSTKKV